MVANKGISFFDSPRLTHIRRLVRMYLYLSNAPRALYLVTSFHDEKLGRPHRALVFRAGEGEAQAVVEFVSKDDIELYNMVRLTNRVVKGCLGLISVENGACVTFPLSTSFLTLLP